MAAVELVHPDDVRGNLHPAGRRPARHRARAGPRATRPWSPPPARSPGPAHGAAAGRRDPDRHRPPANAATAHAVDRGAGPAAAGSRPTTRPTPSPTSPVRAPTTARRSTSAPARATTRSTTTRSTTAQPVLVLELRHRGSARPVHHPLARGRPVLPAGHRPQGLPGRRLRRGPGDRQQVPRGLGVHRPRALVGPAARQGVLGLRRQHLGAGGLLRRGRGGVRRLLGVRALPDAPTPPAATSTRPTSG